MTCTTFLHAGELNQPLPDPDLQDVLDSVRKLTKQDWQVVPITLTHRKWFKTTTETRYGVYVYVGGMGPWQQINFFREGSESSINLYVSLDVVAAYFFGMLNGARRD